MADRGERFRRLRTPETADLFEHFGVPTVAERPVRPAELTPVVSAAACEDCGWYRPLPVRGPCPLCGAPGRETRRGTGRETKRGTTGEADRRAGREGDG